MKKIVFYLAALVMVTAQTSTSVTKLELVPALIKLTQWNSFGETLTAPLPLTSTQNTDFTKKIRVYRICKNQEHQKNFLTKSQKQSKISVSALSHKLAQQ